MSEAKPKSALKKPTDTAASKRQTVMFIQQNMQAQLQKRKTIKMEASSSSSSSGSDADDWSFVFLCNLI